MRYTIQMNYDASIVCDVEGKDEGDALSKAREMAEDADNSDFTIEHEKESIILRRDE